LLLSAKNPVLFVVIGLMAGLLREGCGFIDIESLLLPFALVG